MLSPLASKLSASSHAGSAAPRSNGGTRPGADRGSSAGLGQFDEALTSALRAAASSETKARAASSPGAAKQPSAVPTGAEQATSKDMKDNALAVATLASLPATLPAFAPKPNPTPLPKEIAGDSRMIPGGKKSEKDGEAKDKQPLPSSDTASAIVPDIWVATQAVPAGLPVPVNEKAVSGPGKEGAPLQPVVLSTKQRAVSSEDVTLALPETSKPKETEAFSLTLEPRAAVRSSGSAAIDTSQKDGPDASAVAGQPSKPSPLIQSNKVASSPVTSESSGAISLVQRSGSSKFSGGNGGAEQRDKDEPPSLKAVVGDARENKQGFTDYSSSPVPLAKDIKATEEGRNVQPLVPPALVENQAPTSGVAKEVAIRLQNESGETINVKLIDQGGQVQVTVRSTDPSTATSLRDDLSSLTSSLEKAGWRSEVSLPVGASFEPVNQTRQADHESQDAPGQRQAEWQQETPKKRHSSNDAWDEMLTNQTV